MSQNKKKTRENFRNAVFQRDGYKCCMCGSPETLDAHHITDRRLMPGGGYVKENGISLCPTCHEQAEVFHSTGKPHSGYAPEDLYRKIGSNESKARAASERLVRT